MKVAIYSDRLLDDYFGGAEAYSIRLAALLATQHDVVLFCNKATTREQNLRGKFSELTPDIKIVQIPGVGSKGNPAYKEWRAHKALKKHIKNFDIFINISNNLVPGFDGVPSYALIHFPIYLHKKTLLSWPFATYINKRYVNSYKKLVGNSKFTAENIEKMYGRKADYIYPIAHLNNDKPNWSKKKNHILYVGRIDRDKEIEVLIDAFKRLCEQTNFAGKNNSSAKAILPKKNANNEALKLTIAGFCNDSDYLEELQARASELPINFETNASQAKLKDLFTQAKIYWHSKGYNKKEPWQMEHFGMTTVEAMSYGCIPVVFNGGGQPEIVADDVQQEVVTNCGQAEIVTNTCGILWNTPEELVSTSLEILSNTESTDKMVRNAFIRSKDFSTNRYIAKFYNIIDLKN